MKLWEIIGVILAVFVGAWIKASISEAMYPRREYLMRKRAKRGNKRGNKIHASRKPRK